jgi:hypothetical protein
MSNIWYKIFMKIEEICNSSQKTPIPLKTIINLKQFGIPLFPIEYNIGVDWDKLQSSLSNLEGFFYETNFNHFYMISFNKKNIILVCYDMVQHGCNVFCTDEELYKTYLRTAFENASLTCLYDSKSDEYLLPYDPYYEDQW